MGSLALLTWTFLWLSFLCVGGGLGVIPEMERQAVTVHHWLSAREFVDGYTLAQLTPGPNMLIAVFVGDRAHGHGHARRIGQRQVALRGHGLGRDDGDLARLGMLVESQRFLVGEGALF